MEKLIQLSLDLEEWSSRICALKSYYAEYDLLNSLAFFYIEMPYGPMVCKRNITFYLFSRLVSEFNLESKSY